MRILHVVPSYIPAYRYGGPIKSVHGLCKGLAALGHDVHVFTTNVDGPGDSDVPLETQVDTDGVKVWYFASKFPRRLYWSPPMAEMLKERITTFDLVHLHSLFLWPTWAAARAARAGHVPYIMSPRGMLVRDLIRKKSRFVKSLWLSLIERSNLRHAAALHVTSRLEQEEALRLGYRLPVIYAVPNGVELDQGIDSDAVLPAVQGFLTGLKTFMLYIGRINWKKGLDRLIPALQHIPDVHLVIAGNDEEHYQPALEKLAVLHGVKKRITFTGAVNGADKAALLKNASVLVLPSYSENFGNVVLEAMAQGCPVAVTPEVGAAEIVQGYGAGLVLEGEPSLLGRGLAKMLENPEALREFGNRGRRAIEENFTWTVIAKQMTAVYTRVLHGTDEGKPEQ